MSRVAGSTGRPRATEPLSGELQAVWLGRRPFEEVLERQIGAREAVASGRAPATLLLVEHPPTITLGRGGDRDEVLWSEAVLGEQGVAVCTTPRGGQATLHAPGQLVAYPVVHVGRKIRDHVHRLGEVSAALLVEIGVSDAEARIEHPGVWVGEAKLASIGLHVARGVAIQGVSINLDVDPSLFGALISCGLRGAQMTSAVRVGARPTSVEWAARRWAELYAEATGTPLCWVGA